MIDFITIGENKYYISFGINALRLFSIENNLNLEEMNNMTEEIDFQKTISLIHIGFREGHRKMKLNFELNIDELSDLLDEDPSAIKKAMEIFEQHVSIFTKDNNR